MAVTVEQKTKMYDTPENTSINEAHGIPSQNPDAPSEWGWQSFLTLINHLGVNFSQIKGVAQSATNPGSSKVGDVWFWGDYGSYPYFGQPVTEFNQIGFFLRGASSWSKYTIKTLYSYSIKDGETGETIEKQLDDVTRYNSSTGNFELRGESIRDATITLASFSQAVLDYIGSGGTITNNPDERHLDKFTDGVEKLRVKDGFEGKTYLYNPGQYATSADLKSAIETAATGGNKHLVISDVVDGGGLTWTCPDGTIFDIARSGRITNVTLDGDYDILKKPYYCIGTDVTFSGTPHASEGVWPEMFGAIGNGSTDDFDALQKAFDLARLAEGGNITELEGRQMRIYATSDTLWGHSLRLKNITIQAINRTANTVVVLAPYIDRLSTNFGYDSTVGAAGSKLFTYESNLTKDANKTGNYGSVVDGSGFSEDDIVLLTSGQNQTDGSAGSTSFRGELKKSRFVYGNDVSFTEPIFENGYKYSVGGKLMKLDAKKAEIEGLTIIGEGDNPEGNRLPGTGDSGNGLFMVGIRDAICKDITIKGCASTGWRRLYCYNMIKENYRVFDCLGGEQAAGYGDVDYAANTNIFSSGYTSFNSRHAVDGSATGTDWIGRPWNMTYRKYNLYGWNIYDNQAGQFGFHEGMGSVDVEDVTIHGMRKGIVAAHDLDSGDPTGVTGIAQEMYSATDGIRRYYVALKDGTFPITDETAWALIDSPNAINDEEYNAGTTYNFGDYVTSDGIVYKYINTSPTSGNPVTDLTYWSSSETDYGCAGITLRGRCREARFKNIKINHVSTGFSAWGADKLEIDDLDINGADQAIGVLNVTELTLNRIKVKDTYLFGFQAGNGAYDVPVDFIFNKLEMINSYWNKYGASSYIYDNIRSMTFIDSKISDVEIGETRNYQTLQNAQFTNQSIVFKGFKFINTEWKDCRFLNPYIASSTGVSKYSVEFYDCRSYWTKASDRAYGMFTGINMENIIIDNCNFDLKPTGVLGTTNFIDASGAVSVDLLQIKDSTFNTNAFLVDASVVSVSKFIHDNNTFPSTSMGDVDADYEILSGDSTRKGEQIVDFASLGWTTPVGNISSYPGTLLKDKDTKVVWEKQGTVYGSSAYGILQQKGSDENALTTYTLDCRLNNKFKKTIGAATTFTFNIDGYAEGQFIKFNIWAEPNAGVGVAPSYALTSGTLTPKSKASNYDNTLFTNIEVGLYITASGAEYVIYETSA